MSELSGEISLVKNGSNMYFGDNRLKRLVIICDHVYFFHKNEKTQGCFLSPKGDTDTGNACSVCCLDSLTVFGCITIFLQLPKKDKPNTGSQEGLSHFSQFLWSLLILQHNWKGRVSKRTFLVTCIFQLYC